MIKIAAALLLAGGAGYGAVQAGLLPCPCELLFPSDTVAAAEIAGEYVEARSCTVWGGACHVNGERSSQGRRALAAWHFEAGAARGATVAAAIESTGNLGLAGPDQAPRRAVLWVDAPDARAAEAAVVAVTRSAGLEVVTRHDGVVEWERDGDHFRVAVPGVLELEGDALADRACCSMPESRWYEPLAAVEASVVGNPATCSFAGADGLSPWSYTDANTAYVARLAAR